MVTAVRQPSPYVIVRIVPHFVALGQQRVLTVQLQMSDYRGVAIGYSLWGTSTLALIAYGCLETQTVPFPMAAAGTPSSGAVRTSFTAASVALPPLALAVAMR